MIGPHSPEHLETPLTDAAVVRTALARILASACFRHSEAQARLLRFAVEETLAGRRCKLKKTPGHNLRARLAEYYSGEGLHDPVRIHLPKDGAAPVFSSVAPPAPPVASRAARRLWRWIPLAVVAAIPIGWAGSWWHAWAASAEVRSMVVLPFVDTSPQKSDEWFCDGITQDLIDALARVPDLHVVARTSAYAFKDKAGDIRKIGQQLGVAAVIEGRVRKAGDQLHITVQMNRASDGYHLWAESFDRPAQDVFAIQQVIADAIVSRIHARTVKHPPHRHRPPEQAYSAYRQGRYFLSRAGPQDLDKAVERLEESTHIDAEFALAWAWLSIARESRVADGLARPNQAMPASRDAAERAVALDPDCGEAHLALGIVKLQYDWDWAGAKAELDRALQVIPGSAFALQWRARWLETQGRMDEAISEMQRSVALDPLSGATLGDLAGQYLSINQPERALPLAQRAADLDPDDPASRAAQAELPFLAGQKDQSSRIMMELRNSPAGAKVPPWELAYLAAQQGDPDDARQLLEQAEDLPEDQMLPAVVYARLAGAVQDWDRFFSWIEEAYGERDVQLPYLRWSPIMPKSDPRYADFLSRMNLPAAPAK